jgi:hypothetical protein
LWWVPERALRSWGVRWGCDLLTRSDLLELGAVGPMLESIPTLLSIVDHACHVLWSGPRAEQAAEATPLIPQPL